MRTYFLALLVAGCAGSVDSGSPDAVPQTFTFHCDDGSSVVLTYPNAEEAAARATLHLDGEDFPIERLPAASGARYGNGRLIWWEKGGVAFIEVDGERIRNDCEVER